VEIVRPLRSAATGHRAFLPPAQVRFPGRRIDPEIVCFTRSRAEIGYSGVAFPGAMSWPLTV